ncbi:MAG: hypothetical protein HC896_17460 [Bacteroidales bacterium]|nr:hypothetical protein [Bacteroidales bacterium]
MRLPFNRYGKIVHKYRGNDIRNWGGWDGTHNGRAVNDGVYYYIFKYKAWKENDYGKLNEKKQTGFFHVFTGE